MSILLLTLMLLPFYAMDSVLGEEHKTSILEEIFKEIQLEDLKSGIKSSLPGVKVNLDDVNTEHLLFMEKVREEYQIPFDLFYRLVWYENRFREQGASPKGARGYMQVMPGTFRWISTQIEVSDINDPLDNIKAGAFYLSHQKEKMDMLYGWQWQGSEEYKWKMAVSAYNAGFSVHRVAAVGYRETREYVAFVFKLVS